MLVERAVLTCVCHHLFACLVCVCQRFLREEHGEKSPLGNAPAFWRETTQHRGYATAEKLAVSAVDICERYLVMSAETPVTLTIPLTVQLIDHVDTADQFYFDRARREIFYCIKQWIGLFQQTEYMVRAPVPCTHRRAHAHAHAAAPTTTTHMPTPWSHLHPLRRGVRLEQRGCGA